VALPNRVFALIAAALARVILAALALSLNLSRLKDLLCHAPMFESRLVKQNVPHRGVRKSRSD